MRKLLGILLALALLLSCTAFAEEAAAPALTKDVVILFTSDVHCGIDQGFTYVGVKAVKDQLAKSNYVVLADNGDSIQGGAVGAISKGEANINLMNALGYDVATIGNHEFDYGMDRFLEIAKEKAQFPYVCANFTYKDELVFPPYIIKEFDGVKIAFVGIATPKTFVTSTPTFFQDEEGNYVYGFCEDLTGETLYAAVQKAVDDASVVCMGFLTVLTQLQIRIGSEPRLVAFYDPAITGCGKLRC